MADDGKRMGITGPRALNEIPLTPESRRIVEASFHLGAEYRDECALADHISNLESRLREAERDTARLTELERLARGEDIYISTDGSFDVRVLQTGAWRSYDSLREAADSSLSAPASTSVTDE